MENQEQKAGRLERQRIRREAIKNGTWIYREDRPKLTSAEYAQRYRDKYPGVQAENSKRWRENHPEYKPNKETAHNYYERNKNKLNITKSVHDTLVELLGGQCVKCGYYGPALQVDHVKGNGYKDNNHKRLNGPTVYRRMIKEINEGSTDYQLLCANCNWEKRYENNEHSYRVKQDETT